MSELRRITESLEALRVSLLRLPPTDQPSGPSYPFEGFIVDPDYLERTGSIQGSINHTLEVAFGSRADGKLIGFRHHGPDLVAVVDVLAEGITGSKGENVILLKWVDDLHEAAKHAYTQLNSIDVDALPDETVKRTSKATMKRALIEQETSEKAMEKKQKVAAKEHTERMRARTQGKIRYDPKDVRDVTVERNNVGRKPDEFLEKVTISGELKSNPSQKVWRCSAKGCTHIRAYPRSSDRVLVHTLECEYFSPEIREQAAVAARNMSLVARIDALDLKSTSNSNKGSTTQPSVKSAVQREGQERRSLKHNQLALLLVCGMSLPPTLVDSDYWKELVTHLDPKVNGFSGSHLASALIPAEAARVRELSVIELRKYIHCTLSFDGATTRANDSVYTVHATTPDKRQAHLLAGDEATGLSHTAEHLKAMLLRVIELVGIVSKNGIC